MNHVADKISNPLNFYHRPSDVEADKELSVDDKVTLLTNWLDDIFLRQLAEYENMSPAEEPYYHTAEVERLLHKYIVEQSGEKH